MKKHKVITICGSLKNIDEIKAQTEKLSLAGNCVLSIIYATHDMSFYTEEDIKLFKELHRGNDTRKEFFDKIIDVVTLLGGDMNDAL